MVIAVVVVSMVVVVICLSISLNNSLPFECECDTYNVDASDNKINQKEKKIYAYSKNYIRIFMLKQTNTEGWTAKFNDGIAKKSWDFA